MHIPIARERVRLRDRPGEFLVLRADYLRQVADLADVSNSYAVEENVPFDSIFAVFEQQEAAHRPPQSNRSQAQSKAKFSSQT